MLTQVFAAVRQMLFLSRDVEQNKVEIAALKEQLAETNALVRQLAGDLQRVQEREPHEREKRLLRLENDLLRFERPLPPQRKPPKGPK